MLMHAPSAAERDVQPAPGSARRGPLGAWVRAVYVVFLLAGDIVAITTAFMGAYQIRLAAEARPGRIPPFGDYVPMLGFLVASLLVTFVLARLYLPRRGTSRVDLLGALAAAVTIGNVVAMAISAFTLRGLEVPREILVYAWVLTITLDWLIRCLVEEGLRLARRSGLDPEDVLIIGTGDDAETILAKMIGAPELGYQVLGFVADQPRADAVLPVLGELSDLPLLLRRYGVREVVVADPSLGHAQVLDIVATCDRARVSVKVFPEVFHLVLRDVGVSEFGGLPMLQVRDVNLRGWNLRVKRALDIAIAAILLVVFAPVLMAIALAVKLTSPGGPVFFVQERVGIDGRPFMCVKFRSMRADAEAETGPIWARPRDDRTTTFGRFLRRFSIDELPQLVNVLVGDMSLVGPRPERPHFVEEFSRLIPRYDKRHQEKAGVTGWAQVNGLRGQSSIEERTLYDLFYVEHWSLTFDLKILLKTLAAVIRGRNAY
jgi:exopolysaccharide biosynthesis polyprenyl glycosylphosphotransferase